MSEFLLMQHISKEFPGVKALDDVNFSVNRGEIHVLVGENGAGKSTLMKVLSGIYPLEKEETEKGSIILNGEYVKINDTNQANKMGIYIIHQELNLVPHLSVAENINLGKSYPKKKNGFIEWKKVYESADIVLKDINLAVDSKAIVRKLSVANQQMIEIAKVLSNKNPKIIIMDEPTASITEQETEELFRQIKRLKMNGVSIIYISHRLEEIKRIGDRITIMRDGKVIDTLDAQNTNRNDIIRLMVGREVTSHYPKKTFNRGDEVLRIESFCVQPKIKDICFSLYQSEVLGLAGLVGAGRTELVRGIFGADSGISGNIYIKGKKKKIRSPADAVRNGIAFLTEDRKGTGLLQNLSVSKNITLANIPLISKMGFLLNEKEIETAEKYRQSLKIKTPTIHTAVKNLSGGNQQKVILARWLCRDADIVILDEPTRGIDVGAKAEIYELINVLVEMKKAVILISSDMLEVMGMSDRIAVISNGRLAGILDRSGFNQETIMELAVSELVK
jgi:ABC-type sugar transport system ATPase subunit